MAYPKEKDAIFAVHQKSENEKLSESGFNFLRLNKFGLPVFSKKRELYVNAGLYHNELIPEKTWRYFFRKKI